MGLLTLLAMLNVVSLLATVFTGITATQICIGVGRKIQAKWPTKMDDTRYVKQFWWKFVPENILFVVPVMIVFLLLALMTIIVYTFIYSLVHPQLWPPFLDWLVAFEKERLGL